MSLLVDTSVWSLAFRRDGQPGVPEVVALQGAEQVFTTGLVLQEVLQGFSGPKNREQLVERLSALAFLSPTSRTTLQHPKSAMSAAVDDRCTGEPHQRNRQRAAGDHCRHRSAPVPFLRTERGLLAADAREP